MHTMKRIMLTALTGLMSSFAVLPLYAQPLVSGDCSDSLNREVVQLYRLEHAKPVTMNYQPGETVVLAGDVDGDARLVGKSVVSIRFEPSGKGLGYGTEPQSLAAQHVEPLLSPGGNSIKLVAVNPADDAWLTVRTSCPPAPAPTWVLIPTPTAVATVEGAIVAQVPTLTHTDEMVSSGPANAPVADGSMAAAGEALMERMGQILLAAALLGLILVFTLGKPRRWAQWLRKRAARFDPEMAKRYLREAWLWLCQWVQRYR